MPQYWFAASTEEFMPSEMLEQAKAAEQAGFDGTAASDHWAPWFPAGRGPTLGVWPPPRPPLSTAAACSS